MRYHLPASHPSADAPRAVVGGVAFTHGEADVADAHVPTVGRQLEREYGVLRGPKPSGPEASDRFTPALLAAATKKTATPTSLRPEPVIAPPTKRRESPPVPLTLVTTPGAANANSYADVAYADAYFAAQPPALAAAWEATADAETKKRLLAGGTSRVDQECYESAPASETQRLKFPRAWQPDADGREVAATLIPRAVADATCEVAIALAKQTGDPAAPTGLEAFKELTVGDTTFVPREGGTPAAAWPLPPAARRLLRHLLADGATRLERA